MPDPESRDSESTAQRVLLADGRSLCYAEHGDPKGQPVLFFHGLPSSRLLHPDEDVTKSLNVRLITIDRPGFGLSDPKRGRTLLDWADDVQAFADRLNLEKFALVGASGGAPSVAACCFRLPTRIRRAAILGGSGPLDDPRALAGAALDRRIGYWLARNAPILFRLAARLRPNPQRDLEKFFDSYTRHNPSSDQSLFAQPEIRRMFLASYREATRQGLHAYTHEVELAARAWGFSLGAIAVPTTIWHGAADNCTPLAMGEALARGIPNATLRVFPNEGHLFFFAHWREILEDLLTPNAD